MKYLINRGKLGTITIMLCSLPFITSCTSMSGVDFLSVAETKQVYIKALTKWNSGKREAVVLKQGLSERGKAIVDRAVTNTDNLFVVMNGLLGKHKENEAVDAKAVIKALLSVQETEDSLVALRVLLERYPKAEQGQHVLSAIKAMKQLKESFGGLLAGEGKVNDTVRYFRALSSILSAVPELE